MRVLKSLLAKVIWSVLKKTTPRVKKVEISGKINHYHVFTKRDFGGFLKFIFEECEISHVIFNQCDFHKVSFQKRIVIENSKVRKVFYKGAKLTNVTFFTCYMEEVNFNNSFLSHVRLENSYLHNATFALAVVENVYGFMPDLSDIDWRHTTVREIFFWLANVKGIKSNPDQGFRIKGGGIQAVPICTPDHKDCIDCVIVGCNITGKTPEEIDLMPRYVPKTGAELIADIYARTHPDEEIKTEI